MKNRNEELKRKLKKAASISLCAVLAGGIAAGTYTGVNYLTGYEQNVQAASEGKVELLKSEKKSDDSQDDSKDESTAKGSLDVSDIVEEAMPSIVSITTKSVEEVQSYYGMFGQYGAYSPSQEQEVQGSGSGIIIGKNDSELLIATNYHVVEGAETLSVGFCDSTACEAKVKGYDSEKDLAAKTYLQTLPCKCAACNRTAYSGYPFSNCKGWYSSDSWRFRYWKNHDTAPDRKVV